MTPERCVNVREEVQCINSRFASLIICGVIFQLPNTDMPQRVPKAFGTSPIHEDKKLYILPNPTLYFLKMLNIVQFRTKDPKCCAITAFLLNLLCVSRVWVKESSVFAQFSAGIRHRS